MSSEKNIKLSANSSILKPKMMEKSCNNYIAHQQTNRKKNSPLAPAGRKCKEGRCKQHLWYIQITFEIYGEFRST